MGSKNLLAIEGHGKLNFLKQQGELSEMGCRDLAVSGADIRRRHKQQDVDHISIAKKGSQMEHGTAAKADDVHGLACAPLLRPRCSPLPGPLWVPPHPALCICLSRGQALLQEPAITSPPSVSEYHLCTVRKNEEDCHCRLMHSQFASTLNTCWEILDGQSLHANAD